MIALIDFGLEIFIQLVNKKSVKRNYKNLKNKYYIRKIFNLKD
ncbi:MAG: hypothetical protein MRERV_96c003 [Mycoplasmataceae bacterium RV_VA103A]|nr:MAG: hypothetical protein MRERV_96c003 [Mycoplasmataceae bacterium RV_VA103A]